MSNLTHCSAISAGSVSRLRQYAEEDPRYPNQTLEEFAPDGALKFKMIKGDFRRFEGTWRLRTMPEATALFYELTVQGCLGMPIGLIEQRLRDDLTTNLKAVEAEARLRAAR